MNTQSHSTRRRKAESALISVVATIFVALVLALPALLWTGCARSAEADQSKSTGAASATTPKSDEPADHDAVVKRGEYMVTIGGCNDCHTPWIMGPKGPEPDMTRMLSGHPESMTLDTVPTAIKGWEGMTAASTLTAFHGGWGTSYAMNLTPDSLGGIGTWTEDMFIKTIRSGKHWGHGRPIMPPMPWFNYRKMTDSDLKAVYAYLRTIPPIRNTPPAYKPPSAG